MSTFEIVDVSSWQHVSDENLGSKAKGWYRDPKNARWLLKYPRKGTGDHWAEKIAAELGRVVGLPCPRVELATLQGQHATITESFLPERAGVWTRLVHGNELLSKLVPSYPRTKERNVSDHAIDRILPLTRGVDPPSGAPELAPGHPMTATGCFVGYLAFDAWIGNTDRHHENWGVIAYFAHGDLRVVLAPSFDHAASLGRGLRDEERSARLGTKDEGYTVEAFAARARSHLYPTGSEPRPATLREAFVHAASWAPEAALEWRRRIVEANMDRVAEIVDSVPPAWMSEPARRFALRLLETNRDALEALTMP